MARFCCVSVCLSAFVPAMHTESHASHHTPTQAHANTSAAPICLPWEGSCREKRGRPWVVSSTHTTHTPPPQKRSVQTCRHTLHTGRGSQAGKARQDKTGKGNREQHTTREGQVSGHTDRQIHTKPLFA
uniref:C2H2-type domain-containing protein n=1 Tax=Vitrella brassicaformis TaxID=1169539 RepID=A0A7S1KCL5_9ALVE|mmetsp:Transcript_48306/g.120918  ORF Transcript_48306/g.120918 Transcript_48306/m.120918 type:complete len:129 (+) Transcript_48306:400-786(+)